MNGFDTTQRSSLFNSFVTCSGEEINYPKKSCPNYWRSLNGGVTTKRYHVPKSRKTNEKIKSPSSWNLANSWAATTFKLVPCLHIRNGALQCTSQIDMEQRSVEARHNRDAAGRLDCHALQVAAG